MLVEVGAKLVEEFSSGSRGLAPGGDDGVQVCGDGLPGVLLTRNDDLLGL